MDDSEPDVDVTSEPCDVAAAAAEDTASALRAPEPVDLPVNGPGDGNAAAAAAAKKKAVPTVVVLLAMFLVWRLVRRRHKRRHLEDTAALGLLAAGSVEG